MKEPEKNSEHSIGHAVDVVIQPAVDRRHLAVRPWAWLAWASGTLIVFAILEAIALFNDTPNDTLTRTIVETIPWVFAALSLIVAVVLAVWHWWKAYHESDGRLPSRLPSTGGDVLDSRTPEPSKWGRLDSR